MHLFTTRRVRSVGMAAWLAAMLAATAIPAQADPPKKEPAPAAEKGVIIYHTGYLRHEDWMKASTAPLAPGELDRLVNGQLKKANVEPAKRTTDEQFVRRVWLDLTGRLPMPADVTEFSADKSPNKRAQLIDKLLASDEF